MTRYVLDNYSVAHVFAAGTQDHARSHNGNFYFHGDTLYSYGAHYPVARLDRAKGIAYMNADPSSVTTEGKHKGPARRALRHFDCVYLPGLDVLTRHGFCQLSKGDLAKYIQGIVADLGYLETKRVKMRSAHRIAWNERKQATLRKAAQTVWKLHKRRGDCFRVADRDTKADRDRRTKRDLESRLAEIQRRTLEAPRVAAELAEFECRADSFAHSQAIQQLNNTKDRLCPPIGFGGVGETYTRKTAVRILGAEWVKKAESARDLYYSIAENEIAPAIDGRLATLRDSLQELVKDDLENWVAGNADRAPRHAAMTLRIQGNELQTSQGARVPLPHAIKLTRAAIACKARGKPWNRNGERKRVGAFECDRITQDGALIVGCHSIPWRAIAECVARFADSLPGDLVTATRGA